MAKQDAAPGNDDLFGGIDLSELEETLLTVDVAEGEEVPEVEETVKEVGSGGGGEPPKNDEPPGDNTPPVKSEDKPELLEVDIPAAEKEETSQEKPEGEDPNAQTKKKGEEAGSEENLSPMYLHAAALQEKGLLPDFELDSLKDLKPEEQVLKVNEHIQKTIEDERKQQVDAALAEVEAVKQMYEDIQNGVNPQELRDNMTLEQQFGSITTKALEENEELQEAVYSNHLLMQGISEKRVTQLVQLAKDNDSLLTDSNESLKDIQTAIKDERETMRKDALIAKQKKDDDDKKTIKKINEAVMAVKEIIPGVELTEAEQKTLIKNMTVPVKFIRNEQGQDVPVSRVSEVRSEDPIRFAMRLNYFIEKGYFDKDAKFEDIQVKATTSATKKLIDKMSTNEAPKGTPAVQSIGGKEKEEEFKFPTFNNF